MTTKDVLDHLQDPAGPTLSDAQTYLARYADATGELRGLLGLYLFNAAAQLRDNASQLPHPDEYLQDPLVHDVLCDIYKIDEKYRPVPPLQFLKTGTTSFILRSEDDTVLKLIKPRFWNVESVATATRDYKATYGGLSRTVAPRIHESRDRWILMDFVDGASLADYTATYLHKSSTPHSLTEEALHRIRSVASYLCLALKLCAERRRPLHHLDISPENVLVEHIDGHVTGIKLIDFGVNYLLTEHVGAFGELSRARIFIASELQNDATQGDQLSDVYSLGLLLLEMASTRPLTSEELSTCHDAAWNRCPELAVLIDDMIDRHPGNRLLHFPPGESVYTALPSKIAEAVETHVHLASRKPSTLEVIVKSATGLPVDSVMELVRRALPKNKPRPDLRWVLYWGVLVQVLGIAAIAAFVHLSLVAYDFRWCEALGVCIADRDSPPLPLWEGALGGRVNALVPGRFVAISFALILIKYYAELFGEITTWGLRFSKTRRLTKRSEIMIRAFPVLSIVPIFYALIVDPKAWPFCSALGLMFTCMTNWVVARLASEIQSSAADAFELPYSPFVAEQIATFRNWWLTILVYLASMLILGGVLLAGVAQDEWLYAVFVSVFANMLIMYRHHCSALAPAIRSALQRLVAIAKRLELKEADRAPGSAHAA